MIRQSIFSFLVVVAIHMFSMKKKFGRINHLTRTKIYRRWIVHWDFKLEKLREADMLIAFIIFLVA